MKKGLLLIYTTLLLASCHQTEPAPTPEQAPSVPVEQEIVQTDGDRPIDFSAGNFFDERRWDFSDYGRTAAPVVNVNLFFRDGAEHPLVLFRSVRNVLSESRDKMNVRAVGGKDFIQLFDNPAGT